VQESTIDNARFDQLVHKSKPTCKTRRRPTQSSIDNGD